LDSDKKRFAESIKQLLIQFYLFIVYVFLFKKFLKRNQIQQYLISNFEGYKHILDKFVDKNIEKYFAFFLNALQKQHIFPSTFF
jgi:hypothetical protein